MPILNPVRGLCAALVLVVAAAGLTGCGGGGGSTSEAPLPRPDPAPLAPPQPPATFETAEFKVNWGLDRIQAQSVYADGAYGDGVTVAVIDSGIDTGHTDLIGNISPLSIDIVTPAAPLVDDDGHGTAVAGIIWPFGPTTIARRRPAGSSTRIWPPPSTTRPTTWPT
jgi:subtilisin family serine protease